MTQAPPTVTPPPPPPTPINPQPGTPKGGGMSIAAFVLGLLGFIPPCGLIALILGIVALVTNRAKKGLAIAGIVLGVVLMPTALLVSILLPSLNRARSLAKQAVCMANLNAIGKGLIMYTAENEDQYPPTLEDLIETGMDEKLLRSPADNIDRDCSYFYLAPTSMNEVPPEILVACTYKDVYEDFRHVMRIDCTVTRLSTAEFQAELAKPYNARFAAALKKAEGP
ncbi:MAG TPA: DUF4190 domain-containing protein [Phycisphaerae bacterium]|nr:DUF4190 domain-containing protein [Phycisphaerae bacterium]